MNQHPAKALTTEDWAFLQLLAKHETLAATAQAMGITYAAARLRASRIYKKLDVHGAIEAFTAIGWLRPQPIPDKPPINPKTKKPVR